MDEDLLQRLLLANNVGLAANQIVPTTSATDTGFLSGLRDSLGFDGDRTFGLTNQQIGGVTGLAGLGLNLAALPSQLDVFNNQADLLRQQVAANRESAADRQKFQDIWSRASNSLAGSRVS